LLSSTKPVFTQRWNFIEQLGLQNPFLLFASAAKPIDPVAQRAWSPAL